MMRLATRWRVMIALAAVAYFSLMIATGRLATYGNFNSAELSGLVREEATAITAIDLMRAGQTRHLRRHGGKWLAETAGELPVRAAQRLERALRFMHTARPVRTLPASEDDDFATMGLTPAQLSVSLGNEVGLVLAFELGGLNPDGILRYLRVSGAAEVYLMSGFVGAEWDAVADELFARE
jgi:hypothetical protein